MGLSKLDPMWGLSGGGGFIAALWEELLCAEFSWDKWCYVNEYAYGTLLPSFKAPTFSTLDIYAVFG